MNFLERGHKIQRAAFTRSSFPALHSNDYTYLNTGSSGPPSYATVEAMRAVDEELSGPAYLQGFGIFVRQRELSDRARRAAAALVGAGPDDVALTQNTTHGMNLGVAALDWRPGDLVLSATTEHPGCLIPLHALGRRSGVEVELMSPPVTPEKLHATLDARADRRVRLLALSHVDWTTGELLPLRELCAVAREHGIVTLVDGAQSVGNVPVDAPDTGVDMYAFTGHKWVLGPEGMGALYVRPGLEVSSPNVGYASLPSPADFDVAGHYDLRPDARRFEASTVSPTLCAGLATAAEAVLQHGDHEGIRWRAEYLMDLLGEVSRVEILSPRPAHSGLVSFRVEGVAPPGAVESLQEQKFLMRYIPGPNPCLRASTHLFNTEEELARLAERVSAL